VEPATHERLRALHPRPRSDERAARPATTPWRARAAATAGRARRSQLLQLALAILAATWVAGRGLTGTTGPSCPQAAGCAATAGPAWGTEPASVLQRFQDARNRGDVDGAMALVAPDLRYSDSDGAACPPASPCVGTAAMQSDVQLFIAELVYSSSTGTPESSGAAVHARLASQSPGRSAIGLDRTLSDVTVEVRDSRLISWRSEGDATDPQTAWWLDHRPAR
jgi:hypothetical protein